MMRRPAAKCVAVLVLAAAALANARPIDPVTFLPKGDTKAAESTSTVSSTVSPPPASKRVPLLSPKGQKLFFEAMHETLFNSYFPLAQNSESQSQEAYCGVASSVMVLNALGTPRPAQDAGGFVAPEENYYTQSNVFSDKARAVIQPETVRSLGMTLDEIANFLGSQEGVAAFRVRASLEGLPSVDMFRQALIKALSMPGVHVIANFDHGMLVDSGSGPGHHSPIAAYNAEDDSVLILDVSRYLYTAFWAKVELLYRGCSEGTDSQTGKPRGLTFVWAKALYGSSLPFHLLDPAVGIIGSR